MAFKGCCGLTEVLIPDGVTELGDGAFENWIGLTEVAIPASVNKIGRGTFKGCRALPKLVTPMGATEIVRGLFTVEMPTSVILAWPFCFRGKFGLDGGCDSGERDQGQRSCSRVVRG
jgi:hypothetical protein